VLLGSDGALVASQTHGRQLERGLKGDGLRRTDVKGVAENGLKGGATRLGGALLGADALLAAARFATGGGGGGADRRK
jgi:hypothetical protein